MFILSAKNEFVPLPSAWHSVAEASMVFMHRTTLRSVIPIFSLVPVLSHKPSKSNSNLLAGKKVRSMNLAINVVVFAHI